MLLSMAVQPSINPYLSQTPPKLAIKPLKVSSPVIQKISPLHPLSISPSIFQGSAKRGFVLSSSSASEFVTDDAVEETSSPAVEKQKLGVVVKPMEKPRLVLKFIWMEKNIGLGLDQAIPGHGTIPLSPYYFWPRKDAWEELKVLLESKPWISQKQMIILLNQATDIINLWQQAGGNLQ